jgi:formate hydrogenlyase subunit 3/multisubunit Na+/H+ antiporter MnhD subunit
MRSVQPLKTAYDEKPLMMILSPLGLAVLSVALCVAAVLPAAFIARNRDLGARPPASVSIFLSFSISALASSLSVLAGILTVACGATEKMVLPLGLPDLPFHLSLDPLSGFFLVVIGLLSFFVSIYSVGYVRGLSGDKHPRLIVFYNLFLAGMFMVVLADDALFFLIAWEIMAMSSFFLVMLEDNHSENRRAAFLYLVVAHVGAIAILLSFGVMAGVYQVGGQMGGHGDVNFQGYTFDAMRQSNLPLKWAAVAFFLSFFGFAAKAGVIPLHVWLPEAHPVAPSNVSALMSGVMLKTAVYGFVRVTFDLLRVFPWWWGSIVLVLGLISAVMGVLYALMQHDLKKLLAYHSVENIGIIFIGIGMAMIFASFKLPQMAALALMAGLYHTINHAMFKGLLFMGAGAIVHSTHEKNMDEMGGLIHLMPWTAALFLIGCISISALPPFNGFVSEWLTFQAFLLSPFLPGQLMKLIMPLGAAILALTGALAAACFVKVFGVTFLGHYRGHNRQYVHEVGWSMRTGMILAAATCLALGILPTFVMDWMDTIIVELLGSTVNTGTGMYGWLWLTPVDPERASYSAPIVFIGVAASFAVVYLLLHIKSGKISRGPAWDCGFEKMNQTMQYTSVSFSMPIRRIFGFLFNIRERVRPAAQSAHPFFPMKLQYHLRVRDRLWGWFYYPIIDTCYWIARKAGRLQQGRIQTYLLYSFITIIVLLVAVL